jgi:hypothetical protein
MRTTDSSLFRSCGTCHRILYRQKLSTCILSEGVGACRYVAGEGEEAKIMASLVESRDDVEHSLPAS